MNKDLWTGTFVLTLGQEDVDYYAKMGFPEDLAKTLIGGTMTAKCSFLDNMMAVTVDNDKMAVMNSFDMYNLDGVTHVKKPAELGGDMKIEVKVAGPDDMKIISDSSTYGESEVHEKVSEAGIQVVTTNKTAGSHTQFYKRHVDVNGTYFICPESVEVANEYNKKIGDAHRTDSTFKFCFCTGGNKYGITDSCATWEYSMSGDFDEELNLEFGGVKYCLMMTKTGDHTFTCIAKGKTGTQQFDYKFSDKGCEFTMKHLEIGASCVLKLRKDVDFSGKFKPISTHGMDKFGKVMGLPAELCSKLANDFDARLIMSQKGPFYTFEYKSEVMPLPATTCKLDEEFTHVNPALKELGEFKVLVTRCDNKLISISKGKFNTKDINTFTNNFLIKETHLLGTDCVMKTIMERVCE